MYQIPYRPRLPTRSKIVYFLLFTICFFRGAPSTLCITYHYVWNLTNTHINAHHLHHRALQFQCLLEWYLEKQTWSDRSICNTERGVPRDGRLMDVVGERSSPVHLWLSSSRQIPPPSINLILVSSSNTGQHYAPRNIYACGLTQGVEPQSHPTTWPRYPLHMGPSESSGLIAFISTALMLKFCLTFIQVSYVMLMQYSPSGWTKTSVEGSLFLFDR